MSRLVLGTAQLGYQYGIANKNGQPDRALAIDIIRTAWDGGIREFDTAQGYGVSEEMLGAVFRELNIADKVRVITKLSNKIDWGNKEEFIKAIKESLARLGVHKLYGLLLHNEELLGRQFDKKEFLEMVQNFGVSVYNLECAQQALEMKGMDIIQMPANILDRRFEENGIFMRAEQKRKQIYIRSAFLQGLLLMDPEELPEHISFARPTIKKVIELSKVLKISQLELALGYLKIGLPQANVVVGAETPKQVKEIISVWKSDFPESLVQRVREIFANVDQRVIDPLFWLKCQAELNYNKS